MNSFHILHPFLPDDEREKQETLLRLRREGEPGPDRGMVPPIAPKASRRIGIKVGENLSSLAEKALRIGHGMVGGNTQL